MISSLATAFRMQLLLALRTPNYWMTQLTTPLQVIIFLSVIDTFDRPDLITHALLAPILITMWSTTLWTGGSVVRDDRWAGRLEMHVAAPLSYGWVVAVRVAAVVLLALLVVPITLGTAVLTYGVDIQVQHPWLLAVTVGVTMLAVVGTGVVFSSMTILMRSAASFQSSASYPFLLLGGVFVPLSLLPLWVQPLGRLVFLSWSSDLIRDSVGEAAVTNAGGRMAALVVLGAIGLFAGQRLVGAILHRVRISGEISTS